MTMASLFNKFQQAVKVVSKSPTFAKDPRQLQFEADINRLFLYTSYKRLGKDVEEPDVEEIIDLATQASLADQHKQVQENTHSQIKTLSTLLDQLLLPRNISQQSTTQLNSAPRPTGLTFAVGHPPKSPANHSVIPDTKPLKLSDVCQALKDNLGFSLAVRPSEIPHKEAGQGLFLNGKADVGSVIAIYPGVTYSPAYYRYIPGYPKVNARNSYLITRYDGTVINALPWGSGDDVREFWDGHGHGHGHATRSSCEQNVNVVEGSDRLWKMLSKPLESSRKLSSGDIIERRNPLAFAHFANHPPKDVIPNVMVCPYDFPLDEKEMRPYIPNVTFGSEEGVKMKRWGSFWFKTKSSAANSSRISENPIQKSVILVATRAICDEEILLNYRLSNSKRRPSWYIPVNQEEDRRRWA